MKTALPDHRSIPHPGPIAAGPFAAVAMACAFLATGCQPATEEAKEEATEVAVHVSKATRADLRAWVEAYGPVEPAPAEADSPSGGVRLSPPSVGVVMAVGVVDGQRVRKGDLVLRMDDRPARAAEEKAARSVEFAELMVTRQQKLKSIEGGSERALQEAQHQLALARAEQVAAQAALEQLKVVSPMDGQVVRVGVQPGQAAGPDVVAAEIVDPARLVVATQVPVAEAAALSAGRPAEVYASGARSCTARGVVRYLAPTADERTDSVLARIALPADSGLRAGQFVRVRIVAEERTARLVVPLAAVYTDHEGRTTLSVVEGDVAKRRTVKTGLREGDLVEVEGEGLAEGTTVVSIGSYALPEETRIRVIDAAPEAP